MALSHTYSTCQHACRLQHVNALQCHFLHLSAQSMSLEVAGKGGPRGAHVDLLGDLLPLKRLWRLRSPPYSKTSRLVPA